MGDRSCVVSRESDPGAWGDGDLVLRAVRGDEDGWAQLVARYWDAAYRMARSVVGGHEDAEDVMQESLLVALRRLEECNRPGQFRAWFMRIVWTRAINLRRRESYRTMEEIPPGTACTDVPAPDRAAESAEFWHTLEEGLRELPDVRRRAFLMHDIEGWKHREVAEALGLRSGTARSHVSLARRALQASLGAYAPVRR